MIYFFKFGKLNGTKKSTYFSALLEAFADSFNVKAYLDQSIVIENLTPVKHESWF